MQDIKNKVAVVTGGASGIGEGIAVAAARRGAHVVVADIVADAIGPVTQRLRDEFGVRTLDVPTDVSDPDSVAALAEAVYAEFGAAHLIFNNAGITRFGASWEIPLEDWRRVMDIDFYGCLYGIRAFVPRMLAAGETGYIVNTASLAGLVPTPRMAPYASAKHAVVGLSASVLHELQMEQAPIKVAVVCPGYVNTPQGRNSVDIYLKDDTPDIDRKMIEANAANCSTGMDPVDVGEIIFDAIGQGKFWIAPNSARFADSVRELHQKLYSEAF